MGIKGGDDVFEEFEARTVRARLNIADRVFLAID